jgi:phosphate-selective porin OprO/OprP
VWGTLIVLVPGGFSQDLPSPSPTATTRPGSPIPDGPVSVEQLAKRLRMMEETNKQLAAELERTRREHHEQLDQILRKFDELSHRDDDRKRQPEAGGEAGPRPRPAQAAPPADDDTPVPDYTEGQFGPNVPIPGHTSSEIDSKKRQRKSLFGSFGPGFEFSTEDEEYSLRVHYESQIEARIWSQADQVPANSGIFLPRQRIFFNGNITKPIEYEFSINRGFGNLNLLNAYINIHFNDRFELRLGRFFTPLPYDQYAISNYWLPTPERSIWTTNVGLNRQFGMMGWGYLFDKRLDYAAGVFNGSRNSFESLANAVDFVGYLNARPFQESESLRFAQYLNLGTSVAFGYQNQAPVPVSFRIGGASPNADVPGPGTVPFLILNRNVIEHGERLLGSVHAAYFYKSLSLIGEWQYGYGSYATPARPAPTPVPFSGFYVTGGYFLTGEQVERRTRVTPRRPFMPSKREDGVGPGAWEVVGRVSQLSLGEKVFTGGFADPELWSNSATTTELGLNWYWNEYIKVYMFWLHGDFGDPVMYRPGGYQKTADMFWLRFQLYF